MVEEEGLVDWINDCNLQSWSYNLKEIGSTSRGFHSPRDCLLQVGWLGNLLHEKIVVVEESESPGCAEEFQGFGLGDGAFERA